MPRVKRILVPTDFSTPSNLAINYAIEMAYRFGANVHLVHALEDGPVAVYPDGFLAEPVMVQQQRIADAQQSLSEAAERCLAARVPTTTKIINGAAAATIVEEASAVGSDLIVMGTHGRRGVAHLLLGSVAERVVRTAPCAVLTVRDTLHAVDVLAAEDVKLVPALA